MGKQGIDCDRNSFLFSFIRLRVAGIMASDVSLLAGVAAQAAAAAGASGRALAAIVEEVVYSHLHGAKVAAPIAQVEQTVASIEWQPEEWDWQLSPAEITDQSRDARLSKLSDIDVQMSALRKQNFQAVQREAACTEPWRPSLQGSLGIAAISACEKGGCRDTWKC